jgi:predicted Fe-Mo cluster-binding NifX family protein
MKIAIATSGKDVKAQVDPHFGRCEWYCIYDTETKITDFIENTSRHLNEKAGCNVVDFLLTKDIDIAVAGRFGSKVVEAFRANNIQMIVPEEEIIINEFIKKFK